MHKTSSRTFLIAILASIGLVLPTKRLCSAEEARREADWVRPDDLRCEYVKDPLGIEELEPTLSWIIKTEQRGWKQSAYRLIVASSEEKLNQNHGDLWDSGKVVSDRSIHLPYKGSPLVAKATCYWKVRVWDHNQKPSEWSQPARWTMGLLAPSDWQAKWIAPPRFPSLPVELTIQKATYRTLDGSVSQDVTKIVKQKLEQKNSLEVTPGNLGGDPALNVEKELVVEYLSNGKPETASAKDFATIQLKVPPSPTVAPLFRKEFELAAAPDSAFVTIHSQAYSELYVNGEKVGKDVLSPAVFNAKHQSFSLTYDVSRHLRSGKNCIGLWLGQGWAGRIIVRAQLDAVVAGNPITIGTDTSWKTCASGLHKIGAQRWGDFGGERLDPSEFILDWSKPGLDTASWTNALSAKSNLAPVRSQPCPTNRVSDQITAQTIKHLGAGRYEIDFGRAVTGWLKLKMPPLEVGSIVRMTCADNRPGPTNRDPGYQHFNQISEFVSAGKSGEEFQHRFNYAAFRYVIVEGLPAAPAKEDAVALLVESDLDIVGAFSCSNDLLDRIHQVNQWTQRCLNLGGYYVDCPHRERMGYGDGQVAAEGFMTNFRADGFYRKWLTDWRHLQGVGGGLPNSAPFGKGGGGPGWGGLLSAVTWRHYLYYGDQRVLAENYEAIRRYVEHLERISQGNGDILTGKTGKFSFIGDWVAPRRGMDTNNAPSHEARQIFNNCYRINQIELLIEMARVLEKNDDVEHYSKRLTEIRPKVHQAFYDAEKQQYVLDDQAYYVMPLMTGVTPESLRPTLLEKLEQNILRKNAGHLDTGMLGTYFMMEYLRDVGRSDLVYTMFSQTTYPSWGYMLEQDGTTLWEQWNGYWSRVHSCFTSPDNWLYQGLAGIQADPAAPGFKKAIIKPEIVGDVTWVKSHYDSNYGRIISNWQLDGDRMTMQVAVPSNASATVYVPASSMEDVSESGRPLAQAPGVEFLRMEKDRAVVSIGSGAYEFTVQPKAE